MPSLSAEQLSVLQANADAGDRIAYYSALGAFGFAYGNLALGVVLNNTVSGAAANSFFLDQAGEEEASVSGDQLATISLNLMRKDFEARQASAGADINVDVIQRYHEDVFNAGFAPFQILTLCAGYPRRTVSIMRETLSGLASGVMPWPRLKICGPPLKASTTRRVASISAWPPVTMCSGARLPCTQPEI